MTLDESIEMTVRSCDVELYDITTAKEHDRNIFRVFITSVDGISLDKCAEVSRLLSPLLDVNEPMGGIYNLEVSSPGIERKLKKPLHFKASISSLVRVKNLATDIYKGKLILANDEKIEIETEFGIESLDYNSILSASTYFEW